MKKGIVAFAIAAIGLIWLLMEKQGLVSKKQHMLNKHVLENSLGEDGIQGSVIGDHVNVTSLYLQLINFNPNGTYLKSFHRGFI